MNWQEREQYIKNRDFDELFVNNQGFDDVPEHDREFSLSFAEGREFSLLAICQKRGFVVCVCEEEDALDLTRQEKRKLLQALSRIHYEHLLILCGTDANGKEQQRWLVSIRPKNKPFRTGETPYSENGTTQLLQERLDGLIFPLEEEENLTISQVVQRVRDTFTTHSEEVTKRFYERFKAELSAFDNFIKGIENMVDKKEYAALMLNRLMFIYFIQKKQFLNGDIHYLRNRLQEVKEKYGRNQFHNKFYREFLRRLFKEGFDTPVEQRDGEANQLFRKIPYLNGGLFDAHKLETDNPNINIADEAFERLFSFFEQYNWHLDSREKAENDDINPDVLGYIFEKYINDRAQMGAYYTQEDITEYIAKNTILPYLLQQAKEGCANAFDANRGIWRYLRESPDNYIYSALQHGCDCADSKIPPNIHIGMDGNMPDLLKRRKDWNAATSNKLALRRETWREVIARRQRYFTLREKMQNGEIRQIEDLITYNLDIISFVQKALSNYEGSDFIDVFFRAIAGVRHAWTIATNFQPKRGISILDPACGSGAFLFAALNILQPLYALCIDRMREFVEEDDRQMSAAGGDTHVWEKYPLFRKILAEIAQHPNEEYWIYKTIILENLYGVDMMVEAVEIAKLRLFLQLAAVAKYDESKPNLGLEPLPDIDYNIRAGNSLVGFASMEEFNRYMVTKAGLLPGDTDKIKNQANTVKLAHNAYKQAQDKDDHSYFQEKLNLRHKLEKLNGELNAYMAKEIYGVNPINLGEYKKWKQTHQPFHWLAEFYGIIEESGGFDVIIGNPPYVQYSQAKKDYAVKNMITENCNNLYAMFIERMSFIGKVNNGMITQLSLMCTDKMTEAQKILTSYSTWLSSYDNAPAKLFKGDNTSAVDVRCCIFLTLAKRKNVPNIHTTFYRRWHSDTRDTLFQDIHYASHKDLSYEEGLFPKIGTEYFKNIYKNLYNCPELLSYNMRGEYICYFHNAPRYWCRAMNYIPYFYREREGEMISTQVKTIKLSNENLSIAATALINSSLFYCWFISRSDCRHLNMREIRNFPINLIEFSRQYKIPLKRLVNELMANYKEHAIRKDTARITTGRVIYDEFFPAYGKSIMDKIDTLLASYYGFTEEELDCIINYDYKYRIGENNEE